MRAGLPLFWAATLPRVIVEMLQSLVFWYILFTGVYFMAFGSTTDLKRFFFFSETVWLCFFVVLAGSNIIIGNPIISVNCFFVLVFTACEAIVFASILLIASETGDREKFLLG